MHLCVAAARLAAPCALQIILSDLGLLAVGYGLYSLGQAFGWVWLVKTYFIPYLIVNFW